MRRFHRALLAAVAIVLVGVIPLDAVGQEDEGSSSVSQWGGAADLENALHPSFGLGDLFHDGFWTSAEELQSRRAGAHGRGGPDVPSCFVAGTVVWTKAGPRPIEEIAEGDLVWARDETTGELTLRRVLRTSVRQEVPVGEIRFESDEGGVEAVTVTAEHPFWVKDRGWVDAIDLYPGDALFTPQGHWLQVTSATWFTGRSDVFNFEVARDHSYFVGLQRVWVHNDDCTGPSGGDTSPRGRGIQSSYLSQNIVDDIGRLGLSGADARAARRDVFRVVDELASNRPTSLQQIKTLFPDRYVHELQQNFKGWISIDPVAGNRHAYGGARLLVKRVQGGLEMMVKNTH